MSYIQYSTLIRNKVLNYMLNYGPETQNSYFYNAHFVNFWFPFHAYDVSKNK